LKPFKVTDLPKHITYQMTQESLARQIKPLLINKKPPKYITLSPASPALSA